MLPELEPFPPGGLARRRLFLLEIDRAEDLEDIEFHFERHSAVILAWNAADATPELLSFVASTLLDRGAVSISCWGEDCERVHRSLAETIVGTDDTSPYSASTMTTWHARESFDEALWYALFVAQPTDQFDRSCRDSLVLVIDQPDHATRARDALRDPQKFSESVLGRVGNASGRVSEIPR